MEKKRKKILIEASGAHVHLNAEAIEALLAKVQRLKNDGIYLSPESI